MLGQVPCWQVADLVLYLKVVVHLLLRAVIHRVILLMPEKYVTMVTYENYMNLKCLKFLDT